MFDPTFPEHINAVTKGAKARIIAIVISEGSHDEAPKDCSEGLDCLVNTMPVTKPVRVIKGRERNPTS